MKFWYSAKILYHSLVDGMETDDTLMEECIIIFRAENEDDAAKKAKEIGTADPHTYMNVYNQTVTWEYVDTLEIQCYYERKVFDGMEVFSYLYWKKPVVDDTNDKC